MMVRQREPARKTMAGQIVMGGRKDSESMQDYMKRMIRLHFTYEGFYFNSKEYSQTCPECGEIAIAEYFRKNYSRKDEFCQSNRRIILLDSFKYFCPNNHSSSSPKLDKWNLDRAKNEWYAKFREEMPPSDNCQFDINALAGRTVSVEVPIEMAIFFNEQRFDNQDLSNSDIIIAFAKRGIESFKASEKAKAAAKRKKG
jgi:hypothetical protein